MTRLWWSVAVSMVSLSDQNRRRYWTIERIKSKSLPEAPWREIFVGKNTEKKIQLSPLDVIKCQQGVCILPLKNLYTSFTFYFHFIWEPKIVYIPNVVCYFSFFIFFFTRLHFSSPFLFLSLVEMTGFLRLALQVDQISKIARGYNFIYLM